MYQGKAKYPVNRVVFHCGAFNAGWHRKFDTPLKALIEVTRMHQTRPQPFRTIGYHGIIMPDGSYITGRPWAEIGAHVVDHNRGSLGLLLVETRMVKKMGRFEDYFTAAQDKTARRLLDEIRQACPWSVEVNGHNEFANKLCPGFYVSEWLARG